MLSARSVNRGKVFVNAAGLPDSAELAASRAPAAQTATGPKVLLVVAHPDDEYAVAATVYRITHELGGTVDQVVVTDGAGGHRYTALAERVYGLSFSVASGGRSSLPAIRKREVLAAGRILGIRKHYFLDQSDRGFTHDPGEGLDKLWDTRAVEQRLRRLCARERYRFVLTLLPTPETHGHHQSVAALAIRAAKNLPYGRRPAILGAEPARASDPPLTFTGNPLLPDTAVLTGAPAFQFDRRRSFGPGGSLSYQIVVNWMISEHKSQGLFQTDYNRHELERYWLFEASGPGALRDTRDLFGRLSTCVRSA